MPSVPLTVRQVMQEQPATVRPDTNVQAVLQAMNSDRIGSVLVAANDRKLLGIFTERDLLRHMVTAPPNWRELPVCEWMTVSPHTISPDVGWEEAVELMSKLRIRHMPVLDGDLIVGVISTRLLMEKREEHLNRKIESRTRELRQANDLLMTREAELMQNLRAAGRLQTRLLLPNQPPEWPELRWALHFAPYNHLGGDYYDFAQPDPDRIGFLIADASGHSISAAMVAIMARFAFAQVSRDSPEPGDVLSVMNERLQELSDERFVTAFYGVFERATRRLRYAGAGHPYPLRYEAATGEIKPLMSQGFLLGVMPDEVYTARDVELGVGDKICFYTDGISEARNEIGEMYGTERITQCLSQSAQLSAEEILQQLLASQQEFSGSQKIDDDLTLAVVEVLA